MKYAFLAGPALVTVLAAKPVILKNLVHEMTQ
jgi:hypothetical protein